MKLELRKRNRILFGCSGNVSSRICVLSVSFAIACQQKLLLSDRWIACKEGWHIADLQGNFNAYYVTEPWQQMGSNSVGLRIKISAYEKNHAISLHSSVLLSPSLPTITLRALDI